MDEKHKLIIQKNYVELIHRCDLYKVLPKLIEYGVFSQKIAEAYQDTNKTELNRKRELFVEIQRRGPEAFDKLLSILKEIKDENHFVLACLLEGHEILPTKDPTIKVGRKNGPTKQQQMPVVVEEFDNTTEQQSGVNPFKIMDSQRPNHIRQLSQESSNATILLTDEPLKVSVRKATVFCDNYHNSKVPMYPMRSKCRGTYLAINNMEFVNDIHEFRHGAHVDEENLKELFRQIGFNINSYRNQTKFDMITTIKQFADATKNPVLKKADCLVVAIMSHGEEGDTKESSLVATSDGQLLSVSWILDQFNNYNCPEFVNRPKIFIFQICRGNNLHPSIRLNSGRIQSDGYDNTTSHEYRTMTDMLISYSTLPGDKSYRDTYTGTWYIQLICQVFMKHAYDTDVERLLKMVDSELQHYKSDDGNMQTSCYESRAFKLCYLNPALYMNE